MLTIAVVENDPQDMRVLLSYLDKASSAVSEGLRTVAFSSGSECIDCYPEDVDVLFLDIEMEGIDGIETARRVRAFDRRVVIVFVTNLFQCALEGYEVQALDFLVKPVRYTSFMMTLHKALDAVEKLRPRYIELSFDKSKKLVDVASILYIETKRKKLLVHTRHGDEFCNGPLKELEYRLKAYGFGSMHQSFLVNLRYVEHVGKSEVVVAGETLPISRYKRQEFVKDLVEYVGKVL